MGWPVGVQTILCLSALFLFLACLSFLLNPAIGAEALSQTCREEGPDRWTALLGSGILGYFFVFLYYLRVPSYIAIVARQQEIETAPQVKAEWWPLGKDTTWALLSPVAVLGGVGIVVGGVSVSLWISSLGLPKPLDLYLGSVLPMTIIWPFVWLLQRGEKKLLG